MQEQPGGQEVPLELARAQTRTTLDGLERQGPARAARDRRVRLVAGAPRFFALRCGQVSGEWNIGGFLGGRLGEATPFSTSSVA